MTQEFFSFLKTKRSDVKPQSAKAVLELQQEGATVPFIARYRKEKTGNLDEVAIKDVIDSFEEYNEIVKRQAFMTKEIESQGNLTTELKTRILATFDLGELDEIYRPFKKKKKTRATLAREAGLEPLANWIWDLGHGKISDPMALEVKAKEFINAEAKYVTYEEVLKGAQDIIVEKAANDPALREFIREHIFEKGKIVSKKGKDFKPHSKFDMYVEFDEPVKSLLLSKSSHRYLAMRRGWHEGELTVDVVGDRDLYLKKFEDFTVTANNQATDFLKKCAATALDVHVMASIGNEVHRKLKDTADTHAIQVFCENVKQILLASPFGSKYILGVDPGIRTGCKLALVDRSGNFLSHTVLQIQGDAAEANTKKLFEELFKQIQIEAVAVGNGTGGREAETFLRKVFKDLGVSIPVIMVNESGASVYSASDVAREEFPDLDLTVKGAISIARRLQDPLSELVKIDPKSIGVGQYQHDVNPTQLKKGLDFVVESCVNTVGVDLNTASPYLLGYISGIGPALAKSIVEYRKEHGLFQDRDALSKVPRLSSKVFEQAAGFLRIPTSKNPLDKTGIHPERYSAVREMAGELDLSLPDVIGEGAKKLLDLRTKWVELIGEFTFDDIVRELERPGRDPRDPFKVFTYREDIAELKDVKEEMICPGIVTNVTNFGAFVDIGVHQDGLVHISELTHDFVDDPRKVVQPGQQVKVKVLKVDLEKKQLSLSMKLEPAPARAPRPPRQEQQQARPERQARGPRQDRPRRGGDKPRDERPNERPRRDQQMMPPKPRPLEETSIRPGFKRADSLDSLYGALNGTPAEKKSAAKESRPQGGKRRQPGVMAPGAVAPEKPKNDRAPRKDFGGGDRGDRGGDRGPRGPRPPHGGGGGGFGGAPKNPFNNPFAALMDIKEKK